MVGVVYVSCVVVVVVVVVAVVVVCGLWSCGSAMVVVVLGRCFVGSLSCCCHSTHKHMAYVMSRRVRRTTVAVAVVVEDSGGRREQGVGTIGIDSVTLDNARPNGDSDSVGGLE